LAKVISFFNNKGGVGKTTTSCNVSAGLSQHLGRKVLYIDLDPQCNATLLILGESKVYDIYWNYPGVTKTILEVINPIIDDETSIRFECSSVSKEQNRFGVDLIMGHPRLSSIEDRLGEAWVKVQGGEIGALRRTNWCNDLVSRLRDEYDYIIIDLGPSLGALNRSALIASDYFVSPMSVDIFSIIGLRNIKEWVDDWSLKYKRGITNLKETRGDIIFSCYPIEPKIKILTGCLGYTTQTYASRKNKGGEKRPTKAYEKILDQFDTEFSKNIGVFLAESSKSGNHVLGQIPNMFSLAPIAQTNASPIRDLKSSDGIFGAHYSLAKEYANIFDSVAENIDSNAGGKN
jgi:cellulose biosynthesis protein BcsQ